MKKILCAACAMLFLTAAQADCTYHYYTVNGKTITCTTCCYGTGPGRICSTTCT